MNILTAVKQLAFVTKLFTAAKIDLAGMIAAGDETALAAHIATLAPAAAAPAVLSADLPEIAAFIKTAVDANTVALRAEGLAALTAAGVKPVAADPKVGLVASDITAAITTRISTAAAEQLAAGGTPPVASAPPADQTKPAAVKSTLTGYAKVREAFAAAPAAK